MTFQERNDQGPEDAPAPEFVQRLARELWAAYKISDVFDDLPGVFDDLKQGDRDWFLGLATGRIRAGKYLRLVCPAPGWGGAGHAEPITVRAGVEPVSHGMCAECKIAFAAESGLDHEGSDVPVPGAGAAALDALRRFPVRLPYAEDSMFAGSMLKAHAWQTSVMQWWTEIAQPIVGNKSDQSSPAVTLGVDLASGPDRQVETIVHKRVIGARYEIVSAESDASRLVIRDVGPWNRHPTVTNDAEGVVRALASVHSLPPGRRLFYYDSNGDLDEILVKDGRFAGFAPGARARGE